MRSESVPDGLRRARRDVRLLPWTAIGRWFPSQHSTNAAVVGDDVQGLAVHVRARVAALAGTGEVLVSSSVIGDGRRPDDSAASGVLL